MEIGEPVVDNPPVDDSSSTNLAQLNSAARQETTHTCTFTQDRNKLTLENDFYSIYNDSNTYFSDTVFPAN